jgi:hypothetical protein
VRFLALTAPPDPEFDRVPPNLPSPPENVVKYYQRLVVNPFLGVIFLAFGMAVFYSHDRWWKWFMSSPSTYFFFMIAFAFIQYHCLDCGASGTILGRQRHACRRVRERWVSGRMVTLCFPNLRVQLAIWTLAIADCVFWLLRMHRN